MSKIFFDHLIEFNELEDLIKETSETQEEREELWHLVDEMIHHRVIDSILDNLDAGFHEEFILSFHERPHDHCHWEYLKVRVNGDVEEIIKIEVNNLKSELIEDIRSKSKKS